MCDIFQIALKSQFMSFGVEQLILLSSLSMNVNSTTSNHGTLFIVGTNNTASMSWAQGPKGQAKSALGKSLHFLPPVIPKGLLHMGSQNGDTNRPLSCFYHLPNCASKTCRQLEGTVNMLCLLAVTNVTWHANFDGRFCLSNLFIELNRATPHLWV